MKHSAKNDHQKQVLIKPVPILQRNNSMQVQQPQPKLSSHASINSSSGLSAAGNTSYRQGFVPNPRMIPNQRQNYQREPVQENQTTEGAFSAQLQAL